MRILLWHVHGAWTTAFVQGGHEYLVPTTPDRGPYGLGRARTYPWPDSVREVAPEALPDTDVDLVLLQRPEEWELAEGWLGRRLGVDVPAVFVEHNTPKQGDVPNSRHPMADRDDVTLVHVTHYNRLIWDSGGTRTEVVEHGIPDPGPIYTGDLRRIATAINEPIRRWRVTGTDLLPRFTAVAPVDVYGMKVTGLADKLGLPGERMEVFEDPPQARMHAAIARRRVYLHPHRWTSLGLSLLEAMSCGVPVVVLATTESVMAVPPGAGVLSTNVDELVEGARWLASDAEAARCCGEAARRAARTRYGLGRFLADWDALMKEVTS
ncbi:glycosyltransferase [Planosporangium mesophilum]|uniref:Glycosyl transferase n=1 Tax=Planosporangium mesophilum TaxID=689768 RepID=A0A8J3WZP2_9ACTN|nr:glycosyltransferase [Planosporangium mesophilum]NJC85801.1 glycosyltransferase family 4 protein [Planosporangium mesophilum]GII21861.1 glycosyl transferase [Planosporangium mesophilum]